MPEIRSEDGRYLLAVQGDGNSVVYDNGVPVWDRWSHEATAPPALMPQPAPQPPSPEVPPSSGDVGAMRVIQVTDERDGRFAPRMMSDRANAWVSGQLAYVFAGSLATGGPLFFKVDLASGHVDRLGPLVPYGGETEGWYWTLDGRVVLPHGPRLLSVNPRNSADERILIDISDTHPMCDLWQPHSSDDGRTHSATIRRIVDSGRYPYVGTIIQGPHGRRFEAAVGQLDESQVTRDGSHVVIKQNGEDNLIIDLATGDALDLADADGAIGHSDCGPDFIVGEVNRPGPGRCLKLDLRTLQYTTLFETNNMGYVSVRDDRCLWSGPTHLALVALDGSGVTPLIEHGGGTDYDDRVKANLSPCGKVACYMVNGSVRLLVLP